MRKQLLRREPSNGRRTLLLRRFYSEWNRTQVESLVGSKTSHSIEQKNSCTRNSRSVGSTAPRQFPGICKFYPHCQARSHLKACEMLDRLKHSKVSVRAVDYSSETYLTPINLIGTKWLDYAKNYRKRMASRTQIEQNMHTTSAISTF